MKNSTLDVTWTCQVCKTQHESPLKAVECWKKCLKEECIKEGLL